MWLALLLSIRGVPGSSLGLNISYTDRIFTLSTAISRNVLNEAEFKYLGRAVTNQNYITEDVKTRLNSGNACCYPVQNILSSLFLRKSVKNKIYKFNLISYIGLYVGLST